MWSCSWRAITPKVLIDLARRCSFAIQPGADSSKFYKLTHQSFTSGLTNWIEDFSSKERWPLKPTFDRLKSRQPTITHAPDPDHFPPSCSISQISPTAFLKFGQLFLSNFTNYIYFSNMANCISPPDIFQVELALNPIFNQPKSRQHTISHANEFESPDLRMLGSWS